MPRKRPPPSFPDVPNIADPQGFVCLMERYFEWLSVRNYSPGTIRTRRVRLSQFINWCAQRSLLRPCEITKPILERYQRHLYHYRQVNGKPLTFRSQHHSLVAIRAWFKWLARQNHILYNPASELELPKLENRLPKAVLSQPEAEQVLSQPDVRTATGLRDRAILETFYSTGIRRQELLQLALEDLDSQRGTLMVRQGKGRKDRMIPIGARAVAWIEKYLADVRPHLCCGHEDGCLFLSHLGEPFTPNRLTQLVRAYVDKADIGKTGSCHLFRHTMATLMHENGADIRDIQAMLGHVNLATTQLYTQVSIKKLKQVHTLTHPARSDRSLTVNWDEPAPATADELFATLAAELSDEQ
ncbi:site-specific tyrosine recombinase XerC [Synechococcus sp. PCC 7336]|uniref:site-specific tyrosine recombinase XerC n=1 Tax=Synechococcus sp. PCC 7336 TaxID=195250 RepID=UPI00034C0B17|nr:site-specific tyrosine recombinase XerC [Synechococcus sp. PCC 7336]